MPELLNIFGWLERFLSEHLYPNRYVVTPLLIGLALACLYAAYRMGAHRWIRRHLVLSGAIAAPLLIVGVIAGNYLLSPLWQRSFLEEENPLAAAPVGSPTPGSAAGSASGPTPAPAVELSPGGTGGGQSQEMMPFVPMTAYSGGFVDADAFHFGRGDALIIETAPGVYVLRVENFSVRNGPDLFVYLSEDPAGRSVNEAFNLGGLKATDGAFNYEIPPNVDVSRMKSAVVWCRQFAVLFTHAELQAHME